MTMLSLFLALSVSLIQSASGPTNPIIESSNPPFTRDFQRIRSLGQAKDSAGLENMATTIKARWRDEDMDSYCRLMFLLLGRLRTDFDPIDYRKIRELSEDVLSDLDKTLTAGANPVLLPHYYEYQLAHLYLTYAPKYSLYTFKGDSKDDAWVNQRTDVMTRLLKVWKLVQDAKDPSWDINMKMPSMNVIPPDGGPSGGSPEAIVDPNLRAQYEAEIQRVAEKHKWWNIQYELWKTEDRLKKRLDNDIKMMYSTLPLAPDELKDLLDIYVKDEEQKKAFLEASQK